MTFANPLPLWAWPLVAVGAVAIALRMYRRTLVPLAASRRAALATLRTLSLLLLVVFLMRPVMVVPASDIDQAVVPILVDTSRSMAILDVDGRARIDRASEVVSALLPAFAKGPAAEVLAFGETLAPADPAQLTPAARRSDLTGALRAVRERYRGRTIAGIIVVSDGGDTAELEAAAAIDDASPPVYAIGVGARTIERDREVTSVTAGEAALADSVVELSATAVSHGFGTDPIELRVLENGRPIEVRRVAPRADGGRIREVFHVSPGRDSATVYTIETPASPSELVADNNSRSVLVQPPGRRRRLLLVEGAPGFEHSFLKRAWHGDAGLEIDSVVRKGQNERGRDTYYVQAAASRSAALTDGYPATREALFAYDAIVLANLPADTLSREQLALTEQFVGARGGGLLVFGGRSFTQSGLAGTPLEDVLPVELTHRGGAVPAALTSAEPNRLTLTPEGEAHPVMMLARSADETRKRWAAAPALASLAALGGPRPGAAVLATALSGGAVRPLVAVQRYGEGRVLIFAGEASWRWKMLRPSEDLLYDTFWRQSARWLSTVAPDAVSMAVPQSPTPGEPATITVTVRDAAFGPVRDAAVVVRVAAPGEAPRGLAAQLSDASSGAYTASFRPERGGVYRVTADVRRGGSVLARPESFVLVGGADPELADPRMNAALLQRIALASGGRLIDETALDGLPDRLRSGASRNAEPDTLDIWHTGWSFLIVLLLLSVEWTLRRVWGLR
jgi:uncharacterized membrane protein